jgi:hypothetical protein
MPEKITFKINRAMGVANPLNSVLYNNDAINRRNSTLYILFLNFNTSRINIGKNMPTKPQYDDDPERGLFVSSSINKSLALVRLLIESPAIILFINKKIIKQEIPYFLFSGNKLRNKPVIK